MTVTATEVSGTTSQVELTTGDDDIPPPKTTEEAFPALPRSTAVSRSSTPVATRRRKASATVSSAAEAGELPSTAAQGDALLQMLAQKAMDTEELRKKVDTFLNSIDPKTAEQSNWGQWLLSCSQQIPRHRWAEFREQSYQLICRFLPGATMPTSETFSGQYASDSAFGHSQPQPQQQQHQPQQQGYGQYTGFGQYGQFAYTQPSATITSAGQASGQQGMQTDVQQAGNITSPTSMNTPNLSLNEPNLSTSSSFVAALNLGTDDLQPL